MADKDLDAQGSIPAKPQALILAPTRELVVQIHKEACLYSVDSVLKVCKLYGGTDMNYQKNIIQVRLP